MIDNTKNQNAWWMPAVMIFIRISTWIVFPVIIGLFVGNKLDTYLNTGQTMFILCMVLSFIVSAFAIIKISKGYIKVLEIEARRKAEQEKENNGNTINQ